MTSVSPSGLFIDLNGERIALSPEFDSSLRLLDLLRNELAITSAKDGCSPQGQCGCCTVLIDGQARLACVTPLRRALGRRVVTLEGLDPGRRDRWAQAMLSTGASQCGYCTPGIIMRFEALTVGEDTKDALAAHLCRCTGWQTIVEARQRFDELAKETPVTIAAETKSRDWQAASLRASIEGRARQRVAPEVPLGGCGFVADTVPAGHLVALLGTDGDWHVAETLSEARQLAGHRQGRRGTAGLSWPIAIPQGDWVASLATTWVEPAYLELDSAWCSPGGEPQFGVANGGAFGARDPVGVSELAAAARRLANCHGRTVLASWTRQDVTRLGPKRPPAAGGIKADGSGEIWFARTPGLAPKVAAVAPDLQVFEVDIAGPPTSSAIRGAGMAEAAMLMAAVSGVVGDQGVIRTAEGASAAVDITLTEQGWRIELDVSCGELLDATVARSYFIGAAHMAWSWLTGESLKVTADGDIADLTLRSFNILKAADTPHIEVRLDHGASGEPVCGSEAVFVAVAAAGWLALDCAQQIPVMVGL